MFSQKCELAHFSCNWAIILKARGYFILFFTHTQYGFSSFYLTLTTFEYTACIISTNIGIVNWWYSLQHDLIPFTHEKALSINQETIIINSNLKIAFLRGSNWEGNCLNCDNLIRLHLNFHCLNLIEKRVK